MATVRPRRPQRPGGKKTFLVDWVDPATRKQHTRTFPTREAATTFWHDLEVSLKQGTYIEPGKQTTTLRDYCAHWLEQRIFDDSTREAVKLRFRVHVLPTLGDHRVGALLPSHIQGWVSRMHKAGVAPGYIKVIFANLSAVLGAAVEDGLLPRANPCKARSVKLPAVGESEKVAWSPEQVHAVAKAIPERYEMLVWLGVLTGMRQGEMFGLALENMNRFKHEITVRRQVKINERNQAYFALPKYGKVRVIDDVPEHLFDLISSHLALWPARDVTLPFGTRQGPPETLRLLVTTREGNQLNRNTFNTHTWKPALRAVGIPPTRPHGMHVTRHTFASELLGDGVSVERVAKLLGHSDPGFTLRYYTHWVRAQKSQVSSTLQRVYGFG